MFWNARRPGYSGAVTSLPTEIPTLTTARLHLRPYAIADAPAVVALTADESVGRYLLHVPHPYPLEDAEAWIAEHAETWSRGGGVTWAIARRDDVVIGTASLRWVRRHHHAELGYWLGREHWGHGFAVEAATAALDCAFDLLGCVRVFAQHLVDNHRSARTLERLGMVREGVRRSHIRKHGIYHDVVQLGLLRDERRARPHPP